MLGPTGKKSNNLILVILFVSLILLVLVSFTLGRYQVSVADVIKSLMTMLTGSDTDLTDITVSIVTKIRLPRIIACVIAGAALSVSGTSYQGIFQNPMVSPDVLGATAGAGFGAALGILLSFSGIGIQLTSFVFGLLAVSITYLISKAVGQRENATLVLVLSGMVIAALFSAFVSIIKYIADPYSKLPEITFWLMGSMSTVTISDIGMVLIPIIIATTILLAVRWRLNVLVFGDEEAVAMGVHTRRLRLVVIICSTVLTSSVVAISGQLGWVGLVIPHFSRMIVGPNYKHLLPAALFIGGIYLLIVDNLARNIFPVEIPLGILTAIVGAPCFIILLLRGKRGWC